MAKLRGSIYTFPKITAKMCDDILRWMKKGDLDLARSGVKAIKKAAEELRPNGK